MNSRQQIFFTGVLACMLSACKLDPVIAPPGLGPENGQTVQGIIINGRTISNRYLTGSWAVAYTVEQYYNKEDVVVSGKIVPDKFAMVTLNENVKSISIAGFPAANGYYELLLDYNVFLMKLPADPFMRSSNTPVRITYLNDKSMTWVAFDPDSTYLNGQKVAKAHQVVFIR